MIIYTAQAAEKKEKEKKRDCFVVVAQSKLLCLYFISVWGEEGSHTNQRGLDSNSLD